MCDSASEAEQYLRKAVQLSPDYTWAWHKLGQLYQYHLDRMDHAWEALNRTLELKNDHVEALYDFVWLAQFGIFRPDLAENEADQLIKLEHDTPYACALVGRLKRYTEDNSESAAELLHRAATLSLEDHFAWHEFGHFLLYDIGNLEGAEEALLRAQSLDSSCSTLDADIGLIRHVQGRELPAREHYERSLEIDSENAEAWRAYGVYLFLSGADRDLVENALERAVELEPENFENWSTLAGFLVEEEGREDDAEYAFSKTREVAPETVDLEAWVARSLRPLVIDQ